MKKSIIFTPAIFGLLLLTTVIPAFAQDITPTLTPTVTPKPTGFFRGLIEDGKNLIKDLRDERRDSKNENEDDRQGLRGSITPKIKNTQPTIIQQRLENRRRNLQTLYDEIRNMLTKRFDLLDASKTKIAAKIADRKAQGKDVTAAQAKLDTFDPTTYKADLAAFDKKFTDLMASTNPKQLVKDLQDSAKTVRTDLQDLHKILISALRLLVLAK